jgi:energy-coupling factor transporter transmembrane protein EcfT
MVLFSSYLVLFFGENPFFFQSVAFVIIALAFYAKRTPNEMEATG